MGAVNHEPRNENRNAQDSFRNFFSQRTREGLRVILPLIGGLHAIIALAYWLTAPYDEAFAVSSLSILVTVAAAAASALIARREHRIMGADGLATCVVLLALCNALIHLAASWSPLAVAVAAILVVSAGLITSTRTPMLIIPAAAQGWWALLAWTDNWSAPWMQLETALVAATVVAWGLHYSRRRVAEQLFESEQRFVMQSQRDPLTSLPIRPALIDRLGECFARNSRDEARTFGLCVLNLDGFQKVNQAHGHAMGDLLLQTVAERLRLGCRRSDFVARLGSDEFAVLLDETSSTDHAEAGADRICALACAPVDLDGLGVQFTASYGVVWSGAGFESEEAMLSAAHQRMLTSKSCRQAVAAALESQREVGASSENGLPSLA